jgi:hypothetical protein
MWYVGNLVGLSKVILVSCSKHQSTLKVDADLLTIFRLLAKKKG